MLKKLQNLWLMACVAVTSMVCSVAQATPDPLADALDDVTTSFSGAVPTLITFVAGIVAAVIGLLILVAGIKFGIRFFKSMLGT